jgi:hypothetical protein
MITIENMKKRKDNVISDNNLFVNKMYYIKDRLFFIFLEGLNLFYILYK